MSWTLVGNIKGPQGPPGSGGGSAGVIGEVPSGAINGTNKDFVTAVNFATNSLSVFLNGVRQKLTSDYTITGLKNFQLITAPIVGDILQVDYAPA